MSLVAEPLPPAPESHSVDHRRRLRSQGRNRQLAGDGDDASIGGMTGKPGATEQPLHLHRALRPDRQMSRSRQGQARLH